MSNQNIKEEFNTKELVWAKLKGFPWWPAIIRDIYISKNKRCYYVGYLCEKNGSSLNENNIKKWKPNYEIFKNGNTNKINSKNAKTSSIKNDFLCALELANMYYEEKIDEKDHQKFLDKFQNKKERHNLQNIESFFKNIIKEKLDPKYEEKKINENKIINTNDNKDIAKIDSFKKLIGKKRNYSAEKENNKTKENKEEKGKKNNEINMKQKEIDKMDDIINTITYNIDEILIKSEKYQKFFAKECKEKNISINDNKNIKTKIELIKYLKSMIEILDIPINLNNIIQNMNIENN